MSSPGQPPGVVVDASRRQAVRRHARDVIRAQLAERLAIPVDEVDSIVRLVQSSIDVSLERLLQ